MTKASALSRLRYWLHLVQAPKYGPGFNAAERRSPSVVAGFSCSVQAVACRRPSIFSSSPAAPRCGAAGMSLLAALEFLHRVEDRTTVAARRAPRTITARMGEEL